MEKRFRQHENNIIKITVFGPESTGKTTICKQLASHYNTKWVPEFARDYLQEKWNLSQKTCESIDLLPIAEGQIKDENNIVATVEKILFCDTSLLLTKVFSETYYGFCDPILDQAAQENDYDLFFLTDIDVPWQKDDLRDKPHGRAENFEYFKKTLVKSSKPFITLSGNENKRLETAIDAIEQLILAKSMGLSSNDFVQGWNHGVKMLKIKNQFEFFKNGIHKLFLDRPAFIGDGIKRFSKSEIDDFVTIFDNHKNNLKLLKFVPASGAASRMFKFLNEFLCDFDQSNETINAFINRKKANELEVFLAGIKRFPFYNLIKTALKLDVNYKSWTADEFHIEFIKKMLLSSDFNYINKPKGILPFYYLKKEIVTASEVHLIEAAQYSNSSNIANLHLTISPEHEDGFKNIIHKNKSNVEQNYNCKINVQYSYQKKSTDTLAVCLRNEPLRDQYHNLIFRPGGHGALIENLNAIDADIVFIKNIDNVSISKTDEIVRHKKSLAGNLISMQKKIFGFLKDLDTFCTQQKIIETEAFLTENWNINFGADIITRDLTERRNFLKEFLNRPVRICGMVKNEGEPGGGPFWVQDSCGNISVQIVESSQIDIKNREQLEILRSATHFNPVDLVCGLKDYQGNKFDLTQFVNHNSGFIVQKNKNGQDLKGYELPGLWNGAMHKWISVFVEVPLSTFNPVKTVNDLLKPS